MPVVGESFRVVFRRPGPEPAGHRSLAAHPTRDQNTVKPQDSDSPEQGS